MPLTAKPTCILSFALLLTAFGCNAQTPAVKAATENSASLSPEQARRVEVLIRAKSSVPSEYVIHIGPRDKSDVPGYDQITVTFTSNDKSSTPLNFLLSSDGKTLAQFTKYDISRDPKQLVSAADRPARGGPAGAPVLIVGFDDLECPYCSRMNAQLFPAVLDRYKDQVRIVYRDFPLDQHPWALRASIDTNCVGAQSSSGYWNLVDYIHAHADEIAGQEKTLVKANGMLDTLATDEGKRQNVDASKLAACIAKQDDTVVKQSMKEAEAHGVDSTPALFINGEKIEGAQPIEDVYRIIDGALIAAGQTPPRSPAPAKPVPAAAKPGS